MEPALLNSLRTPPLPMFFDFSDDDDDEEEEDYDYFYGLGGGEYEGYYDEDDYDDLGFDYSGVHYGGYQTYQAGYEVEVCACACGVVFFWLLLLYQPVPLAGRNGHEQLHSGAVQVHCCSRAGAAAAQGASPHAAVCVRRNHSFLIIHQLPSPAGRHGGARYVPAPRSYCPQGSYFVCETMAYLGRCMQAHIAAKGTHNEVEKSWELPASAITVASGWDDKLKGILQSVKRNFVHQDVEIVATLDKLVLYENSVFFFFFCSWKTSC